MDLKVHIKFIELMAYNIKYQQKDYLIIMYIKSNIISYKVSDKQHSL